MRINYANYGCDKCQKTTEGMVWNQTYRVMCWGRMLDFCPDCYVKIAEAIETIPSPNLLNERT